MSELKPCPFCGAPVEVLSDLKRTWGLVRHRDGCLFPNLRNHQISEYDFDAWNTRVERTCIREKHGVKMDGSPRLRCSLCGYGIGDKRFNYCPNCGAKVVRE